MANLNTAGDKPQVVNEVAEVSRHAQPCIVILRDRRLQVFTKRRRIILSTGINSGHPLPMWVLKTMVAAADRHAK